MAEYLAVAALQAGLGPYASSVTVRSAGTRALDGAHMHHATTTLLAERGLSPDGFTARRVDAAMLSSADLVLCAEREHRSIVVTMVPKILRRTFTLREFARLTAGITPSEITLSDTTVDVVRGCGNALVARAVGCRGLNRPERPTDDDIDDPIGSSIEVFRSCAEQISAALAQPLQLLTRAVRMSSRPLPARQRPK